ncbi:MAG: hypothetical protein J07HX64_00321 [halophilic archaeon J07HX64]|nr:MAG: hypothetical protein J07HX64_00321 [halophilic archaeon J07HX64]
MVRSGITVDSVFWNATATSVECVSVRLPFSITRSTFTTFGHSKSLNRTMERLN